MINSLKLGILICAVATAAPAPAKVKTPDLPVVSPNEITGCQYVGIFTGSRRAMWSIDNATRDATNVALERALKAGATSAVITNVNVANNIYSVVVTGYKCAPKQS